jgi:hypothetical protein
MFDLSGVQGFVPYESVETTGSSDNNVRAFRLVTKELGVLGYRSSTKESADSNLGHVLGKPRILVLNLERQLASVAHNEDRNLAVHWLELLKRGENENCGFTVTRLSLAQYIHSENCLRDALLLNYI